MKIAEAKVNYSSSKIFRFKIALQGIEPEIWREIDVPEIYNFWELHVAIQDAMGWLDYHLHEFVPHKSGPTKGAHIGIPGFDENENIIAGWELPIKICLIFSAIQKMMNMRKWKSGLRGTLKSTGLTKLTNLALKESNFQTLISVGVLHLISHMMGRRCLVL